MSVGGNLSVGQGAQIGQIDNNFQKQESSISSFGKWGLKVVEAGASLLSRVATGGLFNLNLNVNIGTKTLAERSAKVADGSNF